MAIRQASEEEIVAHFESLPKGAGSAEERVQGTARYFKIKPEKVTKYLKFWWPGKKYLQEFGDASNGRVRWDRSTEELLAAMNKHGNVAQAAKTLQTTSITLTKALQRHRITQKWVSE
jgi:transcriptional regulator with GAF, ATPase, and Fis domain